MNPDGWVIIGTKFKTDEFEKKYKKLTNKLKEEELKLDVTINEKDYARGEVEDITLQYKKARKEQQEHLKILEEKKAQYKELNDLLKAGESLTPEQYQEYGRLNNNIIRLEKEQDGLNKTYEDYNNQLNKAVDNLTNAEKKYDNQIKKIAQLREEMQYLAESQKQHTLNDITNSIKKIGKSIEKVTKRVIRWGLAIFGVRSAYLFVRQAMSTLSGYDEQLASNIQFIKYALANSIAPVVYKIVEWAYKLLSIVATIIKALTGYDMFKDLSVDKFQKSLDKSTDSAKELKKQLAGFDEMNVLQDNTASGAGAGTGSKIPNLKLTSDMKLPKWVEWLIKNKDVILAVIAGITAGLLAWKLLGSGVLAILVGIIASGIVMLIIDIMKYIKDPSWQNFSNILLDLSVIIGAVGVALLFLMSTNPIGWIMIAIAGVVALIAIIVKLIGYFGDNRAQILSTKDAQEQLTEAQNKAREATDEYVSAVDRAEEAERKLKEAEEEHKLSGEALYKAVQNGTLDYKNMDEAQREVYKAYLENKSAQEDLKIATDNLSEAKKKETKAELENELALGKEKKKYDEYKDAVVKAYKEGKISAGEARDYIERAMGSMSDKSKKTFTEDLPNDIKNGLDPNKYQSAWDKFKRGWNNFWNGLATKLNLDLSANTSGKVIGQAKGAIYYPKLAVGGIINQPGRGMPYHGAVIGERGAEAVVPLTDSQQMALLGEAIGKYITVNANIVNTMNGRVISRELKTIQNQSDFATNGR